MRFPWRRFAVAALVGVGVIGVGSAQGPVTPVSAKVTTAPTDQRVVAFVYGNTQITRAEFGNYLIDIFGKDRVRDYVNRRVMEIAAQQKKVTVTMQEVDAVIAEDCAKLGVNKEQFITNVLRGQYKKTLKEWREDIIAPRLLLLKLCEEDIKVDEEELKKTFENLYGEQVQCKVILWQAKDDTPYKIYGAIRDDAKEFDEVASKQLNADLAARGGMIAPIGRYSGPATAKIEEYAFKLKVGQLSELIPTPAGIMVIKAVERIPAKNVNFNAVKAQLLKQATERKAEEVLPKVFGKIANESKPLYVYTPTSFAKPEQEDRAKRLAPAGMKPGEGQLPTDPEVVAYVYGNKPITRAEFGDYLIEHYGQERIRGYVNRRLIEMEGAKKNITITPKDIDRLITQDCDKMSITREQFVNNVLKAQQNKTLQEWTDDILRPRLIMQQICKDHIKIDDAGLQQMFESLYGEKVLCKVILWPLDQEKTALGMYGKIRENDAAFNKAARDQPNSDLASREGDIAPLGRHSGPATAAIEKIAFELEEGKISHLIKTPSGVMVIKVVKRLPADNNVKFAAVRPQLERELTERLQDAAVGKVFNEMYKAANPLFVYQPRDITREEVEAQSQRLLKTELPQEPMPKK